jgi:hypothetical protein
MMGAKSACSKSSTSSPTSAWPSGWRAIKNQRHHGQTEWPLTGRPDDPRAWSGMSHQGRKRMAEIPAYMSGFTYRSPKPAILLPASSCPTGGPDALGKPLAGNPGYAIWHIVW